MHTMLTSVSVVALSLMLGAPAIAQTSPSGAGSSVGAAPSLASQGQQASRDQIKDKLDQVGVKDRQEFKGRLVRAESPEGHPVLLVVGPEDMKGDKAADVNRDKIRGKLTTAGFKNIEFVDDAQMVRGEMGDDKAILALAGNSGWRGSAGPAQSGTPNLDRLTKYFDNVLDDRNELKGKLLRAKSGGQTTFVLVGPEDFKGDTSVNFSAGDLSKFQQNGFQNAEMVDDVKMIRGKLDGDMAVVALAGRGIAGEAAGNAAGSSATGSGSMSGTSGSTGTKP